MNYGAGSALLIQLPVYIIYTFNLFCVKNEIRNRGIKNVRY